MKLFRKLLVGCLLLANAVAMGGEAEAPRLSTDGFARLAIHRNGRAMPMDSVARHFLMEFSGRGTVKVPTGAGEDSVEKLAAIDWFARVLFDPETTDDDPIFLVEHPEAAEALNLPRHKRDRFTYNELKDAIPALREKVEIARTIAPDDRGLVEQELLRVDANLQQYLALRISFMFAVPRHEFAVRTPVLRNMLELKEGEDQVSFWRIMGAGAPMAQLIESIQDTPQSEWTPAQSEALMLSSTLFDWSKQLRGLPLLMVPLDSPGEDVWVSPWDAIAQQAGVPRVREKIGLLADMTMA